MVSPKKIHSPTLSSHHLTVSQLSSQIRAAHSLLSLSHSLKLLHLFADTATTTTVRDVASKKLEEEIAEARETIRRIVEGQDDTTDGEDEDADMEEV